MQETPRHSWILDSTPWIRNFWNWTQVFVFRILELSLFEIAHACVSVLFLKETLMLAIWFAFSIALFVVLLALLYC